MALAAPNLEIAANSIASALAAQEGGASRVELCSALELGGVTPSQATIECARARLKIPLYVLIRPRAGDFLYTELDFETMLRDIELCASLGCDGVVIGALDAGGNVQISRCRELIAVARGMGVTFHRAFDCTHDPFAALEDIIALGCERVLTSGQRATALQGARLIHELIDRAHGRIAIMPGAGITSANIAEVAAATGARELHASAKRRLPGANLPNDELREMSGGEWRSDATEIRAMLRALTNASSITPKRCER